MSYELSHPQEYPTIDSVSRVAKHAAGAALERIVNSMDRSPAEYGDAPSTPEFYAQVAAHNQHVTDLNR